MSRRHAGRAREVTTARFDFYPPQVEMFIPRHTVLRWLNTQAANDSRY